MEHQNGMPSSALDREQAINVPNWKLQMQQSERERVIKNIKENLEKNLPHSDEELSRKLTAIAERLEETVYSTATSEYDYLRNLDPKVPTMETESEMNVYGSFATNPFTNPGSLDTVLGHPPNGPQSISMPFHFPGQSQVPIGRTIYPTPMMVPHPGYSPIHVPNSQSVFAVNSMSQCYPNQLNFQPMPSIPNFAEITPNSTAQTWTGNESNWQEETYQKIKLMKDQYLHELKELKVNLSLLFPLSEEPEPMDTLRLMKLMLEHCIIFLQISKHDILPSDMDDRNLVLIQTQILSFIDMNRRGDLVTLYNQFEHTDLHGSSEQNSPNYAPMASNMQNQSSMTEQKEHRLAQKLMSRAFMSTKKTRKYVSNDEFVSNWRVKLGTFAKKLGVSASVNSLSLLAVWLAILAVGLILSMGLRAY